MYADWSVELGADDAALEFPWASPDGSQRYLDLQRYPEQLKSIPEAKQFPELGQLLLAINSCPSPWLTVKCDVWSEDELGEAEAVYEATRKLCSYVDLLMREYDARFSFHRHQLWVKTAAQELQTDDGIQVACEFIVRRCWYHTEANPIRTGDDAETAGEENPVPGFYVTFYLSGYGEGERQARAQWAAGLCRVTAVLTQLVA